MAEYISDYGEAILLSVFCAPILYGFMHVVQMVI